MLATSYQGAITLRNAVDGLIPDNVVTLTSNISRIRGFTFSFDCLFLAVHGRSRTVVETWNLSTNEIVWISPLSLQGEYELHFSLMGNYRLHLSIIEGKDHPIVGVIDGHTGDLKDGIIYHGKFQCLHPHGNSLIVLDQLSRRFQLSSSHSNEVVQFFCTGERGVIAPAIKFHSVW